MAAITQIVDEQIKQIRKERAELDALRVSLEQREQVQNDETGTSSERKQSLLKEIDELESEVKRLREERDSSIENFGGEMNKVHVEKTAESEAHVKQLQSEINFLLKGKTELEEEISRLKEQLDELEEKSSRELNRIADEKENVLSRTRAERETSLKEINLAHSVAIADLEREKKELENEISALEQNKTIEQNRAEAEISRYKTAQLSEIDALRNQLLAEMEKEKGVLESQLRAAEHKSLAEISGQRRDWEKEILQFQAEKQKLLDEIKLLEYEFEKNKSENIVKHEKIAVEHKKMLDANRAEALEKLEQEQSALSAELKLKAAELKKQHREEAEAAQKEISECNAKKDAITRRIDGLEVLYEQKRADNEASLESHRAERLMEIDEQRLVKLQEVEELRQQRIAALETMYLEKSERFEAARAEKLEEFRKLQKSAEDDTAALKQQRADIENEIKALRAENEKIKEENAALDKSALIERQLELEKRANEKLAEIEVICNERLASASERAKQTEANGRAKEEKLAADIADGTETLLELRRMISAQKLEIEKQRDEELTATETAKIEAAEKLTQMKLAKLSEIETYLDSYKNERLASIQEDIARQSKTSYRQAEELAELNEDYNRRLAKLREAELSVEADKQTIEFKNKQIEMLQQQNNDMGQRLAEVEPLLAQYVAQLEQGES
ncbi:MAG: hypothetical protein FWF79_05785 [Defluviitaleaceae bacterium]|nr:hypothetical protein [Defluviitaleaceae bacterium]